MLRVSKSLSDVTRSIKDNLSSSHKIKGILLLWLKKTLTDGQSMTKPITANGLCAHNCIYVLKYVCYVIYCWTHSRVLRLVVCTCVKKFVARKWIWNYTVLARQTHTPIFQKKDSAGCYRLLLRLSAADTTPFPWRWTSRCKCSLALTSKLITTFAFKTLLHGSVYQTKG